MQTHCTPTIDHLLDEIREHKATIARLSWNIELDMLNGAGIREAIRNLPDDTYAVIFFDVDKLKQINSATGNHFQTNRYLRRGLRVRKGELIGQWYGDEFVAVLRQTGYRACMNPAEFIHRIDMQLRNVPLPSRVRCALGGRGLSATFAGLGGVSKADILPTLELLSRRVLELKAERDASHA